MCEIIRLEPQTVCGTVKALNAVNNGPIKARKDQVWGNVEAYREAGFSYARPHDAALYYHYGGAHVFDITAIFPNFDADETDPASYDFQLTDELLQNIRDAGTEVFFRLGQSIEHSSKKYGTLPPKDHAKWARICEHIIRHYNEGWANGFAWNITYWEIWNEPDLDREDSLNKRTWGGTKAEFFDFYACSAKHLKACFPHLKIGGPALAHRWSWAEEFLNEMQGRAVPIDFFSWHCYTTDPKTIAEKAMIADGLLKKYGYGNAESILDEWNYVRGWGEGDWIYSIRSMIGLKGSSFVAAVMSVSQDSPIDMLMYYDASPCVMNGLFDYYTMQPLKTYYVYRAFHQLYALGNAVLMSNESDAVYGIAASDGQQTQVLLSHYREEDDSPEKDVILEWDSEYPVSVKLYLIDESHNGEEASEIQLLSGRCTLPLKMKLFDTYRIVIQENKKTNFISEKNPVL